MSPWWHRSSSKDAKRKGKNKANLGCIFGLIRRKLKIPSENNQISSRNEVVFEMGSNLQASSPSIIVAQSQNFDKTPHSHLPSLPVNVSDTGRVDLENRASRNIESSKGSSQFVFPVPKFDHARNGHNHNHVERDSVFTVTDGESNDPSSHVITTRKKRQKQKQIKECVNIQMMPASSKQLPSSRHMVNLQIPKFGGFLSAPDSSKTSPSKSLMRVTGSEPGPNNFWAMRSSADIGFFGPGPGSSPWSCHTSQLVCQNCRCTLDSSSISGPSPRRQIGPTYADPGFLGPRSSSSPGFGYNSSQLLCQNCRRTLERGSPMPSPRMTSPVPSPIRQSGPTFANWPGGAVNGKHQTHRLPLPPGVIPNTSPYSPVYSPRTTPAVPKSPGRVDLVASPGSRWKKGQLLGRGAYGHVYLGFNNETGEMCAMKEVTLFADDESSNESVQQLGQEITLLSRLRHPNIVQYYGSETVDDKLYIYLEYVSGGSIHKLLREYGAFGELPITNFTRQILEGLAYLHSKNTVHRDIKGANILVNPNAHIKLADFGVAKRVSGPSCALSFKGSAHWMAPELINNTTKGCSLLVDIWSLGCTVHEMATTKPPWSDCEGAAALFNILNNKEIQPPGSLSDEGKNFVLQCMQRVPSHRPSAAQLLHHPFVKDVVLPDCHNTSYLFPPMGQFSHSRTNPISSPRSILGSPTLPTGAPGGGVVPSNQTVYE